MRVFSASLSLLLISAAPLCAQVTVEVTLDQEQFLQGESLPVAVRITNRSGQALRLGEDPDWLAFSIESRDGFVVPKNGEAPATGEFVLESSKVAIKRVNLAPYFVLTEAGRYGIVATVRIKGWGRELTSPSKHFNIIEGVKLCEYEVGLPKPPGATNPIPEIRKYILQQANYLKQLRLFLRVTDNYGRVFRVVPIGPLVSFGRPETQVDKLSNLHVLYQHTARFFTYTVFNPDGELTVRQTYEYVDKRPRLQVDPESNISVLGGIRRVSQADVPALKADEDTSGDTPTLTTPTDNPAHPPDRARNPEGTKP